MALCIYKYNLNINVCACAAASISGVCAKKTNGRHMCLELCTNSYAVTTHIHVCVCVCLILPLHSTACKLTQQCSPKKLAGSQTDCRYFLFAASAQVASCKL